MISARYRAAKVLKKGASLRDTVKFLVGFLPNKHPYGMQKQSDFGNFVIIFKPVMCKIGNFVIKISVFDPFLALAKNLTRWSRPNERTGKKSQGRPFDRLRDLKKRTINKQTTKK